MSFRKRLLAFTYGVTLFLYCAACLVPAIQTKGDNHSDGTYLMPGWEALVVGWWFMFDAIPPPGAPIWAVRVQYLAWLANPFLLAGLVLLAIQRSRSAFVAGVVALVLGVCFLVVPSSFKGEPVIPLIGAILWVISFIGFTLFALANNHVGSRATAGMLASPTDQRAG